MGKRIKRYTPAALSLLLAFSLLCLVPGGASADDAEPRVDVKYSGPGGAYGSYSVVTVSGMKPYVFMPTGAGSDTASDFLSVHGMIEKYGEQYHILAAINAGIFYAGGGDQLGFHYREADGVVIAGGTVLKSTESIDHTECDIFVVDEDGNVGWADYFADADALAAGTGTYYDIYGKEVSGKKIYSAVTGFVPILVGGEVLYDPDAGMNRGYDNFVGHYFQLAQRQIFGVREDGSFALITNTTAWTLETAAEAAKAEGCVFAYNFDGGGSAGTVTGQFENNGKGGPVYSAQTVSRQPYNDTPQPTFIIFTDLEDFGSSDYPAAGIPAGITAGFNGSLKRGSGLAELAGRLTVYEQFNNANGGTSERRLYSSMCCDPDATLYHTTLGTDSLSNGWGETGHSVSPDGVLYYRKTDIESLQCLRSNGNTRDGGRYYDYSTGFTLSSADDFGRPGMKTVTVSYFTGTETLETSVSVRVR